MRLFLSDIENAAFDVVKDGYDRGQVDAFLAEVTTYVRALEDELSGQPATETAGRDSRYRSRAARLPHLGDEGASVISQVLSLRPSIRPPDEEEE